MPTRCRRANSLAWPSKCPDALDRKYVIAHKGIYSLATETEYVRSRLAQYGNDLLSLGVDGLRLDAAKRQSPSYSLYTPPLTVWSYRHRRRRYLEHFVTP